MGSWTVENEQIADCEDVPVDPTMVEFDDLPVDPADEGPKHCKRLKEIEAIYSLLLSMGWTEPVHFDFQRPNFQPERLVPGSKWEHVINRKKQEILDKKNEHNSSHKLARLDRTNMNVNALQQVLPNIVKVVNKSYLEKSFRVDQHSGAIQDTVQFFSLNTECSEQERAFRIIANHIISANPEQLCMYLEGMGGTGKTQVIKALSYFFR